MFSNPAALTDRSEKCTGKSPESISSAMIGNRSSTHAAALAARFPDITVDDSLLYLDDGDVLTSAGMTAAVDLCLHLVRCDLGATVANRLARRMVIPPHRSGGQA